MYSLTAAPSPSTLQQQTSLAKEFAQEGTELVHCFQQMYTQTRLLWFGWQALLLNFSSMQRSAHCHYLGVAIVVMFWVNKLT